jgi:signal transduction histidine kinase
MPIPEQVFMNPLLNAVLPLVMRAIRHPRSGLTALLAVLAEESGASSVGLIALYPDDAGQLLSSGGKDALAFGLPGPIDWAKPALRSSGSAVEGDPSGPWTAGQKVEWRSSPGSTAILSLVACGTAIETEVLDELAGLTFLMGELILVRNELDGLSDRLRRERQDRALIAASLQHDLRTPLSSILGFAKILRGEDDLGSEETTELLDLMVSEAEHMADLVADGLRREAAGPDSPLKLGAVDPAEVAANVVETARNSRHHDLVIGVERGSIITDPARLTRALLNLVDNALKYSPEDAPVRLSGGRDGDHYLFVVADSGPGVPDEMVPTLFQPYTTDPSRPDGTGLGLYSVATTARELGGRVAYARRGDWTTFSLWIPSLSDMTLDEEKALSDAGAQ